MRSLYTSLSLIAISIMAALIFGPMLRNGMFLDGLVYTNIAKNLSNDIGDVWHPLVTKYGEVFFDQPPFLPWLESVFFRVFGDGVYTEDFFNFIVFVGTVFAMFQIWKQLNERDNWPLFVWPLLFWVLGQEVQLRYPNAMLECGMTLIILMSVYLFLRADGQRRVYISYGIVGLGAFLAFLSKGPAGLFLLSFPGVFLFFRDSKIRLKAVIIPLLIFLAALFSLFWLMPDAQQFFSQYFHQQVLAAINGERVENIAGNRFDFIGLLLMANLPAIGIGLLIWLIFGHFGKLSGARERRCKGRPESRVGWSLVVVGLLAVLPLVISIKQAAYYQLPALPFFALGFGLLLLEPCRMMMEKLSIRKGIVRGIFLVSIAGVVASSIFALSMFGTTDRRDVAIIESAQNIATALDSAGYDGYNLKILGKNRWAGEKTAYPLTAYLARLNDVHLNQRSAAPARIYLLTDGTAKPPVGEVLWREKGIWVVGISFD